MNPVIVLIKPKILFNVETHEVVCNASCEPGIGPGLAGQEAPKELLGNTESHHLPCFIHLVDDSVAAQEVHAEMIIKECENKEKLNCTIV